MNMINSSIGKYKIIRLIGEGGMASVYEAEHEMLGTRMAIKVLNPIFSANAQVRERFMNEAKMMASLDHPYITKVIDFDEQPHQLSIVMEYLNGEDLNKKIKRNGPLNEVELIDIFSQILSAFQYAHEKGVIHRDIKPSNIFVLPNGHIKILDFGIAKLFGQVNDMTLTGTQLGTPVYMSPEQVKADKSIDQRSDIYSLGVTMFFAINGKPPYDSNTDSQFDIFTKIVYEPLPPFSSQGKFNEIVLKACQKNREERFQSCNEWLYVLKAPIKFSLKNDEATFFDHSYDDKKVVENIDNENTKIEEKSRANIINTATKQTGSEQSHTGSNTNNNHVDKKFNILFLLPSIIIFFVWISGQIMSESEKLRIFGQDDISGWLGVSIVLFILGLLLGLSYKNIDIKNTR